ncbi:hypothetical protein HanRHA438_Chr17g0828061 [Helianthus annuus]|nr:hypothetical protein HanRHA438_Chr17g0828061 [Helianthus annuus]
MRNPSNNPLLPNTFHSSGLRSWRYLNTVLQLQNRLIPTIPINRCDTRICHFPLTNRTFFRTRIHIRQLIKTTPTKQVTAACQNRIPSHLQTNITIEETTTTVIILITTTLFIITLLRIQIHLQRFRQLANISLTVPPSLIATVSITISDTNSIIINVSCTNTWSNDSHVTQLRIIPCLSPALALSSPSANRFKLPNPVFDSTVCGL